MLRVYENMAHKCLRIISNQVENLSLFPSFPPTVKHNPALLMVMMMMMMTVTAVLSKIFPLRYNIRV